MSVHSTPLITVKAGAPPMDAATARVRDLGKTLLAIVLVCCAMPFLTMSSSELTHTVSLWQLANGLWRLELVKALPDAAAAMVLLARVAAWAVMAIAAVSWLVMVTRFRGDHFRAVMLACLAALLLTVGLYYYLAYLFAGLPAECSLQFEAGGVVVIASLLLTSLLLLTTRLKRRTALVALLIFVVIPATIAFGLLFLGDRKYYIISMLVILETMLPFFMVFEQRQPAARELILIAVMAAIAVAGRAAFFMTPQFKPMVALIIITGVSLGPEAGFLAGALAGFVSNFFFGQGPWTPWQMFAYGICGYLAGVFFRQVARRKRDRAQTHKEAPHSRAGRLWQRLCHDQTTHLCIFGALCVMLICGPLLDVCTFLTMAMQQTPAMFWAILLSGLPFNAIHATATVIFLALLAKPMNEKLDRIKLKYGLLEP